MFSIGVKFNLSPMSFCWIQPFEDFFRKVFILTTVLSILIKIIFSFLIFTAIQTLISLGMIGVNQLLNLIEYVRIYTDYRLYNIMGSGYGYPSLPPLDLLTENCKGTFNELVSFSKKVTFNTENNQIHSWWYNEGRSSSLDSIQPTRPVEQMQIETQNSSSRWEQFCLFIRRAARRCYSWGQQSSSAPRSSR